MTSTHQVCSHASLVAGVSPHGLEAGYKRIDWKRRTAATTPSGRVPKSITSGLQKESPLLASTYPAPLVLPEDDLACDPSHAPQSFRSWSNLKARNRVTCDRRTIYIARPPIADARLLSLAGWKGPTGSKRGPDVPHPHFDDVLAYLCAFYNGFEVKEYAPSLTLEPWELFSKEESCTSSFVGLQEGPSNSYTRVRTRSSPDGLFPHQLNLNDILDCAINIIPDDAYALLVLTDYDLYEDDDDDFCCGRAYGGSRVAVVSSARYNPLLFEHAGIDLDHMWPAAHCVAYVDSQCGLPEKKDKRNAKFSSGCQDVISGSPLQQAVAAFQTAPRASSAQPNVMHGIWLFCLARTASHELGHCFGMDHCVYYACAMQGTASVVEDLRQPPYLCPICLKKLSRAVEEGSGDVCQEQEYVQRASKEMVAFCAKWQHVCVWAGYEAWLRALLYGDESV